MVLRIDPGPESRSSQQCNPLRSPQSDPGQAQPKPVPSQYSNLRLTTPTTNRQARIAEGRSRCFFARPFSFSLFFPEIHGQPGPWHPSLASAYRSHRNRHPCHPSTSPSKPLTVGLGFARDHHGRLVVRFLNITKPYAMGPFQIFLNSLPGTFHNPYSTKSTSIPLIPPNISVCRLLALFHSVRHPSFVSPPSASEILKYPSRI